MYTLINICSKSNLQKLVEEFSHTVLHGENFKNKIQNLAAKPKAASAAAIVTPRANMINGGGKVVTPMYDPSRIYKTPIVPRGPLAAQQQQPERKISAVVPSPAARVKRPESAQRESAEDRKVSPSPRGSYFEQQRLKRAAAEEDRLKKKQAELIEKQKVLLPILFKIN